MIVQRETPDQPEVSTLLAQADARSASLYPAESRHGLTVSALVSANVRFFVARHDGQAIGCGGYMLRSGRSAELKRLFVDPPARGRGVGRAILHTLEQAAADEDVATLLLETGIKSVEAIQLYGSLGYRPCGPFEGYGPDPLSVFMVKHRV